MSTDQDFRFPSSTVRRDNMPPLTFSSNSHPAYQPFKLNVKTGVDLKMHKIKLPEKPMAPFMRFSKKIFDQVKMQNPEAKQWELGRVIQQMWKDLSDQEKQEYVNEYENAKFDYCEQLKAFHNSPQYQSFLSSNAAKKSKLPMGNGQNVMMNVNNNPTLSSITSKSNDLQNNGTIYSTALSHYAIEPAEDDGIDESLSLKSQASNRFQRNHRLLNEIFNEFCVQDNRSIVTQQRMEQLKKQVASLETHQEKLKQELTQIEDKYEAKKRKFLTSSQDFEKEMTKMKEFKVTEDQENQSYTKHYELVQKQWKEFNETFPNSLPKNITKEGVLNMLRDGLDNLISNKGLIAVSNPTSVTVVALQQPVETPEPEQRPTVTQPRFNSPAPQPRPATQIGYQLNAQRSTNTPPINPVSNSIISPNQTQPPVQQRPPPQNPQPRPPAPPVQQGQMMPPPMPNYYHQQQMYPNNTAQPIQQGQNQQFMMQQPMNYPQQMQPGQQLPQQYPQGQMPMQGQMMYQQNMPQPMYQQGQQMMMMQQQQFGYQNQIPQGNMGNMSMMPNQYQQQQQQVQQAQPSQPPAQPGKPDKKSKEDKPKKKSSKKSTANE